VEIFRRSGLYDPETYSLVLIVPIVAVLYVSFVGDFRAALVSTGAIILYNGVLATGPDIPFLSDRWEIGRATRLNSSHVKISYACVLYTLSLHDALPISVEIFRRSGLYDPETYSLVLIVPIVAVLYVSFVGDFRAALVSTGAIILYNGVLATGPDIPFLSDRW